MPFLMQCPCHGVKECYKQHCESNLQRSLNSTRRGIYSVDGISSFRFWDGGTRAAGGYRPPLQEAELALLLFGFGLRVVAFLRLSLRLGLSVRGWLCALAVLTFFFRDGLIDHQRRIHPFDERHRR